MADSFPEQGSENLATRVPDDPERSNIHSNFKSRLEFSGSGTSEIGGLSVWEELMAACRGRIGTILLWSTMDFIEKPIVLRSTMERYALEIRTHAVEGLLIPIPVASEEMISSSAFTWLSKQPSLVRVFSLLSLFFFFFFFFYWYDHLGRCVVSWMTRKKNQNCNIWDSTKFQAWCWRSILGPGSV